MTDTLTNPVNPELERERALVDALNALESIGQGIQQLAFHLSIALVREDLPDRERAHTAQVQAAADQQEADLQAKHMQAEPAEPAQPAPKKTRAKKAAPVEAKPAPEPIATQATPAPEQPPAVQPTAQELDAAIALALQPPGVPIPSGMTTWDSFPSVEPDDSVTPGDMRDLIKRLMAATAALHADEGLQVVRGSLAAVGALRLAEVPDWQLLNLRSAVTHGNIDLRVQIAAGEL
jgi:hypothetical protein